jgi:hypothetical protein
LETDFVNSAGWDSCAHGHADFRRQCAENSAPRQRLYGEHGLVNNVFMYIGFFSEKFVTILSDKMASSRAQTKEEKKRTAQKKIQVKYDFNIRNNIVYP